LVVLTIKFKTMGLIISGVALVAEAFVIGLALVTVRVDFELRHYLVGDRSLRVAQGAWKREEVTLSYANVQNLEVTQGPIERLFGFRCLTISTAGAEATPGGENSHLVKLVGLENADEVRALILGMLKHQRDSGLGEPSAAPSVSLNTVKLEEIKRAALALRDLARVRFR
jgi:membrane protein YdbS with pleckstrin-like domain